MQVFFEVFGIIGIPPLLTCFLARLLAHRQGAKLLSPAVTIIRDKNGMAVLTLSIFDVMHDLLPPGQSSSKQQEEVKKKIKEGRK